MLDVHGRAVSTCACRDGTCASHAGIPAKHSSKCVSASGRRNATKLRRSLVVVADELHGICTRVAVDPDADDETPVAHLVARRRLHVERRTCAHPRRRACIAWRAKSRHHPTTVNDVTHDCLAFRPSLRHAMRYAPLHAQGTRHRREPSLGVAENPMTLPETPARVPVRVRRP